LLLATSSTALAATKVIKFGKLVDGTGGVLTNAVVIVEDDRVQRVVSGNASMPSGAEVIDLSRYTGVPGLIDAHTHITYYWDGNTMPRYEPPRHPVVTAFLAQENAQKALEAGVTTIRNLNAADGIDLAMRDLINTGKMIGPRMFVSGLGIRITRSTAPPAPVGIMADGVDAVIHAVRQVIASGADWVKMYGSTGGFDDVTEFQTFTFDEMKAAVDATQRKSRSILTGHRAHAMLFAQARTRSNTRRTWTIRRLRKWSIGKFTTSRRSITTSTMSRTRTMSIISRPARKNVCSITFGAISKLRGKRSRLVRAWWSDRTPFTMAGG
jgi:imidazolonepropionase-like amidohydrolase